MIPFILMATKGVDITIVNGLFLSSFWMSYTLFITSPLYPVLGRFFVLLIYLPIIGVVFYKQPHEKATPLFLFLGAVFWDFPLICWMKMISFMGGRALKPFYSSITSDVAMGSMPLATDAKYLKEVKNIGFVVNMCREYDGPVEEYAKLNILQLRLPTPDVCEPNYTDILRGVHEILNFLRENSNQPDAASTSNDGDQPSKESSLISASEGSDCNSPANQSTSEVVTSKGVFIHCKAGRGRAATMTLCYLLATTDLHINDVMRNILEARSVVEPSVKNFRVVRKFLQRLEYYEGDFEALYLHDYVLGGAEE